MASMSDLRTHPEDVGYTTYLKTAAGGAAGARCLEQVSGVVV